MMGSCDTGIVTWYSLGASGYGAMVMVETYKSSLDLLSCTYVGDMVSLVLLACC